MRKKRTTHLLSYFLIFLNFLFFFVRDSAVGGGGHGAEVVVEVLEVAGDGYHGGVVRGVAEAGDEYLPAVTTGVVVEGVAEARVRRDTACHCHLLYLQVTGGKAQLLHQDIHDGLLQGGGKVALVVLDKVRVLLQPVAQVVEEARLQSAETVVVARDIGFGEGEGIGVALPRQTVDDGSARVA